MKAVVDQYRLPAPNGCPPALHSLMLQCWQADRQDRLGFDSLLSSLDRLIRHPASLKAEHSRWDAQNYIYLFLLLGNILIHLLQYSPLS